MPWSYYHFMTGLLQYSLHGTTLEEHPETTVGIKYSSASSNGHHLICPCVTTATQVALVASCLLGEIQDASGYL